MGVGGQRQASTALHPGKTRYSLYRRLGRPQGRSGWMKKSRPYRIRSPDRPATSRQIYVRTVHVKDIEAYKVIKNVLRTERPGNRRSILAESEIVSHPHRADPLWAHVASYRVGNFPSSKAAGA